MTQNEKGAVSVGHTPGPWSFRELRGDDGLGYITADDHDIIHAGVSDLPADENRANARLIAAAPELLEALEVAPLRGRNESPRDFDDRQTAWLRDFYRPAIARARGEQA